MAGNTVVFKPANQGALLGCKLYEIYRDAGFPPGAFHYLPGRGAIVGDAIVEHPDVNGITFTGSYEVGMGIYKTFAQDYPKPAICEMGGKNPTIVTKNADLDKATDGVLRTRSASADRNARRTPACTFSARSTTTSCRS